MRVVLAAGIGALLMFPLDRWAVVGSSVERLGDLGLGPLPDPLRLATEGPPHLGVVGLALGAAVSSWVEYRVLRGALAWRVGPLPRRSIPASWCVIGGVAAGVLAAGVRANVDHLPDPVALVIVGAVAGAFYLGLTVAMRVPEALVLTARLRRLGAPPTGRK